MAYPNLSRPPHTSGLALHHPEMLPKMRALMRSSLLYHDYLEKLVPPEAAMPRKSTKSGLTSI